MTTTLQSEHATDTLPESSIPQALIGAVAIGRNEGERLHRCLESLVDRVGQVVYVDSGSTDGSVELAESLGVHVVNLNLARPFTAARARNEGIAALREIAARTEFVQVIDGWLEAAWQVINENDQAAIVCGRRRERFPDSTLYNRLCDMEWDGPAGEVSSCGGDALIRLSAFKEINGYDGLLIAGEEPEMCVRLRAADWKILRIDQDMAWHDAAMSRFGQFWMRAERAGHAYAEGNARHGHRSERFRRREVRSIVFWSFVFPLLVLALAVPTFGASCVLAAVAYGRQWIRIRRDRIARGDSKTNSGRYASFVLVGKFGQLTGIAKYWMRRVLRRQSTLIEYK
jgi:glycosyltransferase involved in cell wall biosynthesis